MSDGFAVSGQLTGLTDALARLDNLKQGVRNRILRPAVTKGCRVIAKRVKTLAPVAAVLHSRRTDAKARGVSASKVAGLLKRGVAVKVSAKAGKVLGRIGIRKGKKQVIGRVNRGKNAGKPIYQDPARIAHLVELGHGGPHPAPAHSFLRRGFDETKASAAEVMTTDIAAGIVREARKGK